MADITHNTTENGGKFIVNFEGQEAGHMTYTSEEGGTVMKIDHTEVSEAFSGKGLAKELVFSAVDYAKENAKKIHPACSFAKSVLEKDETFKNVLI